MPKKYYIYFYFFFNLGIFFIFQSPTSGADCVNIGVVGAMEYAYGKQMWNGALMAADEINKRGGVRIGKRRMRVTLTKADSKEFLNVGYATNIMEMLLFRNNVDFVVGGFRSEAVLGIVDLKIPPVILSQYGKE